MGYQDRHYYRDTGGGAFNPILWLWNASLPLFTVFDIRVRAHSTLIIAVVLTLLFGYGVQGFTWQDRVQGSTMLFLIVLLHEFGHCFASRWVGGTAHEILMHPLGGLAFPSPPPRPLPVFLTVAGGPAVNVLICAVTGVILWVTMGVLPWNPFTPSAFFRFSGWWNVGWYAFWIYQTSYTLLIFNLLPIYPLDGGQMVQAILWPYVGYYRSMLWSCSVGMVATVIAAAVAIATGNIGLGILAILGFWFCLQRRRNLVATGPDEYSDMIDYSAAYETFTPKPRRRGRWAAKRALKLARQEVDERDRIDKILAKVSAHGMQSLTWVERRALKKATEHQRQRDEELSRIRGD